MILKVMVLMQETPAAGVEDSFLPVIAEIDRMILELERMTPPPVAAEYHRLAIELWELQAKAFDAIECGDQDEYFRLDGELEEANLRVDEAQDKLVEQ